MQGWCREQLRGTRYAKIVRTISEFVNGTGHWMSHRIFFVLYFGICWKLSLYRSSWNPPKCKTLLRKGKKKKRNRTIGALLSVLLTQCVYLIIQFCNLIYGIRTHISSNFLFKLPKPEWSSSKLTRSSTSQRQEPLCLTCILNIASSHLLQMTFPQTIFQHIRTRLKRLSPPSSICIPCLTGCRERRREEKNTVRWKGQDSFLSSGMPIQTIPWDKNKK